MTCNINIIERHSSYGRDTSHSADMDYDEILRELGEFGHWQMQNYFLLCIPMMVSGMTTILPSFTVMEPRNGFRCKIPQCDGPNFKFEDYSPEEIFPSLDSTNFEEYNPEMPNYCEIYQPLFLEGKCEFNKSLEPVVCRSDSEYVYAKFEMDETIATLNNLVCK